MDIASVLQQVQGISLNFCGMNLSWVPSEVGGIDIIVPIAAGISAWLLCVAQNAANVIQAGFVLDRQQPVRNFTAVSAELGHQSQGLCGL